VITLIRYVSATELLQLAPGRRAGAGAAGDDAGGQRRRRPCRRGGVRAPDRQQDRGTEAGVRRAAGGVRPATDSTGRSPSHARRAGLHSWSFHRLRAFIAYKAAIAGVPVRLVDPCDTSRTCRRCGRCTERDRPTRDDFRCVGCGFAGPADHNAAINIGRRAAVNQPNAA
jgi:transposase